MATTHVFIVDKNTLKYHLEFLFAGTGAGDKVIDFNNNVNSKLHFQSENGLAGMMADINRIRVGDNILFYLQQDFKSEIYEGKFFGVFKVEKIGFIDNNDSNQFLQSELKKSLTFRILIEPSEVYSDGITEWEALDEIKNTQSPNQMIWSLIYRKLKGNRGNTMITIYEFDKLKQLIRNKNNKKILAGNKFTFDVNNQKIIANKNGNTKYLGRQETINLLPRLNEKYKKGLQFEAHLQAYLLQNIEKLNIFQDTSIEWIGNEVSCGVGMQRIDIMLSLIKNNNKICCPIELKSTEAYLGISKQVQRYVDWLHQYYLPNRPSDLEPMIISRKVNDKQNQNYLDLIQEFKTFNHSNMIDLRYVEFEINNNVITFNEITY